MSSDMTILAPEFKINIMDQCDVKEGKSHKSLDMFTSSDEDEAEAALEEEKYESPDMFAESDEEADDISRQSTTQTIFQVDQQINELKVSLSQTPPSQAQEQEAEVLLSRIEEGVSHLENLAYQHASGQEVDKCSPWRTPGPFISCSVATSRRTLAMVFFFCAD